MHQPAADDPDLVAEAVAYVSALRAEVEAESGPVRAGAGRDLLERVLADPALSAYVRRWARQRRSLEEKVGALERLPADEVYGRLRAALLAG
jgi:hypothetical protein